MTVLEAAALAALGVNHRRFLAVALRVLTGRSSAEDADLVPPRGERESVIAWACRSRFPNYSGDRLTKEVTRVLELATRQLRRASEQAITALAINDARYPAQLAAIPDPPPVLWVRGDASALSAAAIALVGSRAATPYGLHVARHLAADLARAQIPIVSGLARGIDSAAHLATLRAEGQTIAVLGCGPDRIYPSEHRDLAVEIAERGALVSEFPPGTPPLPHHFPLRNRIISGLSRAVVVVEAPEKSGALITAAAALEQGREVLVVPGPVTGGRNRGGHLLIRDGAKLVESAVDIFLEMRLPTGSGSSPQLGPIPELIEFSVDDVSAQSGQPPNVVLARLLELELAGQIQRIGCGRFARRQERVLP